jgi:hypothetical protein
MMRETVALLIPAFALGIFIVPRPFRLSRSSVAACAFALCLGIGFSSLTTMAFIEAGFGPATWSFVQLDVGVWACVLALGCWIRRGERAGAARPSGRGGTTAKGKTGRATFIDWILRAGFAATAVAALGAAIASSLALPHGEWDAWAIWNQHARFLFRGGDRDVWHALFAIEWAQPDYPLLVPAAVARQWAYAGRETILGPASIAIALGMTAVTFVVTAIDGRRAWIAGALTLGAGTFLAQIPSQTADVPLACFIVAALVAASGRLEIGFGPLTGTLVAGAASALAAWTKNEGIVFAMLMLLWAAVVAVRRGEQAILVGGLAGAAPVLAALAWFKLTLAPPSVLFAGQSIAAYVERLFDLDRQVTVTKAIAQHLMHWGAPYAPGTFALMGVAALWLAARGGPATRGRTAVVGLMLVSYYLVYMTTPLDLTWHVATSFDRLLVQLWPALVLTVFAAEPLSSGRPIIRDSRVQRV